MSDDGKRSRGTCVPVARGEGAFLAFAAGDALGWPQEMRRNAPKEVVGTVAHEHFRRWTRRAGGRFGPYEEAIQPGDYSDDTQLTLAVARSRTNHAGAWWQALTRVELPLWTVYERGGGSATKRAARAWARGHAPWKSRREGDVRKYFNAGGNGVAMRVLPHALFLAGEESAAGLVHDVVLDGSATHGHPRALVGAAVYAYAAWCLARRSGTLRFGALLDTLIDEESAWSGFPQSDRNGGTWFEAAGRATDRQQDVIWDRTTREMRALLETARKGIRAGVLADDHSVLKDLGCFGQAKGAGTISSAAAVYLATRHAAQPVQGVLSAGFANGADTDTLAAMAGGLLGCLAGIEWIPVPWLQVQDADYLRHMASRVVAGPTAAREQPVETLTSPESIFPELPEDGEREIALGGFLRARAISLPAPRAIAKSIAVRSWRLSTSDGQTMYVNRVRRLSSKPVGSQVAEESANPDAGSVAILADTSAPVYGGADSADMLYTAFCRQLWAIAGGEHLKRRDVEMRLGLVPSQVKKWLQRAEQDGRIQWTSKKPAKFILSGNARQSAGEEPGLSVVRSDRATNREARVTEELGIQRVPVEDRPSGARD